MLDTLRRRLILSHILPLLLIIPVVGIALIYVLESQVLLTGLGEALLGEATLVGRLIELQPDLWDNPSQAQAFVDNVSQGQLARLMLIDTEGRLLASSSPTDAQRLGHSLALAGLDQALAGEVSVRTTYSQQLEEPIADVMLPVRGASQQVVGVIRLSHHLDSVVEQFVHLRYLIVGVLITGLILGGLVGLLLALNMERPLSLATQAILRLASGQRLPSLSDQGPAEIRVLLHAVNSLVERLHSLEQARRQLLANLVHELGRPLGALRAAIQALLDGAMEDQGLRQELLGSMIGEIDRLRRLLDTLAQLHEQVLGTLELSRQPIALSGWLAQVLVPWRESAYKKGLHWEAAVPANLPTVEADPDRLAQILGNLLSNAIKYTPGGGTVSVKAGATEEEIWVRVSDTGFGISPQEQKRIFESFYRGHTLGRFPQGMGLGLTIARDLVMAHRGRIELESGPDQGSHFTIWLPRRVELEVIEPQL